MAERIERTYSEGVVEYTIHEHIAVLDRYEGREVPWTREINIVSWRDGPPKVDIREWSSDHRKMSRGITMTEDQAMKMAAALVERYQEKAKQAKIKAQKNYPER